MTANQIRGLLAVAAAASLAGQQPLLSLSTNAYVRQPGTAFNSVTLLGRTGDVAVLGLDLQPGRTPLLGAEFDLALGTAFVPLWFGTLGGPAPVFSFQPSILPARVPFYLQAGLWDPTTGLPTLMSSNVESFAVHDEPAAIVHRFDFLGFGIPGVFDPTQNGRLRALPAVRRVVRPVPRQAAPIFFPLTNIALMHPGGARYQLALRASDLGGTGAREQLVAVRWRPLFGAVQPETVSQFEIRAAHSDIVPDYTIDPFSALPAFPNSGLATTFAANPRAGTEVVCYSGPYGIQPANLLPSGYVPFPNLQTPFVWDGLSTLLLETRRSPEAVPGAPRNHVLAQQIVQSGPDPFAMLFAVAGDNGNPSPLPPASTVSGRGSSTTYDLELEFERTESFAEMPWSLGSGSNDYGPAIAAQYAPPGTSIVYEYRGGDLFFHALTPWSTNQDVADGLPALQVRVTMTVGFGVADLPWVDTLIVPVQ